MFQFSENIDFGFLEDDILQIHVIEGVLTMHRHYTFIFEHDP